MDLDRYLGPLHRDLEGPEREEVSMDRGGEEKQAVLEVVVVETTSQRR